MKMGFVRLPGLVLGAAVSIGLAAPALAAEVTIAIGSEPTTLATTAASARSTTTSTRP